MEKSQRAALYLGRLTELDHEINSRIEEKNQYKKILTSAGATQYDKELVTGGRVDYDEKYQRLIKLNEHIDDEIDDLVDLRNLISRQIDMLEDRQEAKVLRYRYVNNYNWSFIHNAVGKGQSERNVYKIHKKALDNFYDKHHQDIDNYYYFIAPYQK